MIQLYRFRICFNFNKVSTLKVLPVLLELQFLTFYLTSFYYNWKSGRSCKTSLMRYSNFHSAGRRDQQGLPGRAVCYHFLPLRLLSKSIDLYSALIEMNEPFLRALGGPHTLKCIEWFASLLGYDQTRPVGPRKVSRYCINYEHKPYQDSKIEHRQVRVYKQVESVHEFEFTLYCHQV